MVFWLQKEDEDEGRITCGNTILSGSVPECDYIDII